MEREVIESLTSPEWWVSVVLAGIVVNLFAAYVKPFLDKVLSSYFSRWKAKTTAEKEKREHFLTLLRSDTEEFHYYQMVELGLRTRSIYALLAAVFILLFSMYIKTDIGGLKVIPFLILSMTAFFISFYAFNSASTLASQLQQARRSRVNK